ncbi:chlorophyll synthesis pathway protein BchC [Rhodoblastus sphagnicola]|uniref:Chlorophyll synthesis pathway protein BchC n=1 Tax=Rhodoblastus sphagnicola TaxID=333368 RepID=A0A2S6NCE5_9HYPH|nr:chlorophyll synthesis pathway protein BchC [Rhodoblastus sphagnicola]MBB4196809.1 3-hydroxyethyl bacteriochlorophyllide a dehydrogenase [Rhodoblastus sphagnicola]PPQ32251.1 chlorophyll synthesis pathway protein BchC [Rhodoblastus sphagnicola]
MQSVAVVMEEPRRLKLASLVLDEPGPADIVVETLWSGVSAGTEKLLYTGRMPLFPGMGYPLVPGYETVGRVIDAGPDSGLAVGANVFVPGAHCFGSVSVVHGGSASHLVVPGARAACVDVALGDRGVLLALAATALHAVNTADASGEALVVGHGALGRLIARLLVGRGVAATVWETNPLRATGAEGYRVLAPGADARRDYRHIIDVSGDAKALDSLIQRLAPRGRITLAGFYEAVGFAFAPAFMREVEFRISAQWAPGDLGETVRLVEAGELSLDGLITHRRDAREAAEAYSVAFEDPTCVKMVLDWSAL